MTRVSLSVFLCCFGGFTGFQAPLLFAQQAVPATAPDTSPLKIVVIAGANATNILRTGRAVPPVVEVRGADNRPVPAAVVTFDAPESEPSVLFSNGTRSQSLVTGVNGRAVPDEMRPVGVGPFTLLVNAALDHHFASSKINEINVPNEKAARQAASFRPGPKKTGLSTRSKYAIIAGAAAAAALGIAIGLTRGSSSTTTTITGTGGPTVGGPR